MLTITNPATGAVIRELPEDTKTTIADKVQRARAAQGAWAAKPLAERLTCLRNFRDALARDKDRLAAILTSEVGKPLRQSHNEIGGMAGRLNFFLDHTEKALTPEIVWNEGGMEERISWEPLGVVANISAWNYPYFVSSNVFIPALLTGNAVVYKPSEFATLTGLAMTELLHAAGVPKDVFACVVGGGAVGAEVVAAPIDGVFFVGSYPTGKKIAEAAAGRLIKVQLELGGKDPAYVCEDVDVKAAAEALADGAFYNNGQSCCAVERVYVHERVAPAFIEAFVNTVKGFVTGDPMQEGTYIGPLTRAAQKDVVAKQIADAVAGGAKLACGGKAKAGPGNYFEPTVLTNVNARMAVMREESFGPVIGIQTVKDDAEAIAMMNDTDYGLTAAVYTQDGKRAERLLSQVNAGTAYWNCCDRVSPRLPWTGRKHSGIGSSLSTIGIRAFVTPKAYHLRSK